MEDTALINNLTENNDEASRDGRSEVTHEMLMGALESILFVTGEPLPKPEIARAFSMNELDQVIIS